MPGFILSILPEFSRFLTIAVGQAVGAVLAPAFQTRRLGH